MRGDATSRSARLSSPGAQRCLKILSWVGLVLAALVAALFLVLAFIDWNSLKGPIERIASSRMGRAVSIAGPLDVRIWSWTPEATVNGLTLGNPPWERPDRWRRSIA